VVSFKKYISSGPSGERRAPELSYVRKELKIPYVLPDFDGGLLA
jgi:hypothetical protein